MPYSVYIIRCGDGTLYTGIANDVERRLAEHRDSKRGAKYLRGRGPLELVFSAGVGSRSAASKAEYRIKRLSHDEKQRLISGRVALPDILQDQVAVVS